MLTPTEAGARTTRRGVRRGRRARGIATPLQLHVPMDVLIVEVARRRLAARKEALRAVRAHPDEVARLHLVPGVAQVVAPLPLQEAQPVLHDVGLGDGQRESGREG